MLLKFYQKIDTVRDVIIDRREAVFLAERQRAFERALLTGEYYMRPRKAKGPGLYEFLSKENSFVYRPSGFGADTIANAWLTQIWEAWTRPNEVNEEQWEAMKTLSKNRYVRVQRSDSRL